MRKIALAFVIGLPILALAAASCANGSNAGNGDEGPDATLLDSTSKPVDATRDSTSPTIDAQSDDATADSGDLDATLTDASNDSQSVQDASIDAAIDATKDTGVDATADASVCAYSCDIDLSGNVSTTTCAGRVTTRLQGKIALSRLDLSGLSELELTFTTCDPTGWVLHLADDGEGNDGYGAGYSSNCSETQLVGTSLTTYANDYATSPATWPQLSSHAAVIPAVGCKTQTWFVRDKELKAGDGSFDDKSDYGMRLNPPKDDRKPPPDAIWNIGMNRVYGEGTGTYVNRTGTGLTKAHICLR